MPKIENYKLKNRTMSKKIQNQEEVVVAEAVSKTEKFFEENGKKVIAPRCRRLRLQVFGNG